MIAFLTRLIALCGITVVVAMVGYYLVVHHNNTPADVENAYLGLVETMLVYVAGCLLLFASCLPNVIWKWDSRVSWQKAYLAGLVVSFPGLGLGIMLLVASLPK